MQSTAWSITTCSWLMIIDLYQLRLVCNISSLEGQNGNWDLSRSLYVMEELWSHEVNQIWQWNSNGKPHVSSLWYLFERFKLKLIVLSTDENLHWLE